MKSYLICYSFIRHHSFSSKESEGRGHSLVQTNSLNKEFITNWSDVIEKQNGLSVVIDNIIKLED